MSYAKLLIKEWGLDKQSAKFRREVKTVLEELRADAQLQLRLNPKLQVQIIEGGHSVWAYFPVHKGRKLGQDINPATRVLLRIGSRLFDEQSHKSTGVDATDLLRDHLGHTLLYLRSPKARNDCRHAQREWNESSEPKPGVFSGKEQKSQSS